MPGRLELVGVPEQRVIKRVKYKVLNEVAPRITVNMPVHECGDIVRPGETIGLDRRFIADFAS